MNRRAHEGEPLPNVPSPPLSQFPAETPLGTAPAVTESERWRLVDLLREIAVGLDRKAAVMRSEANAGFVPRNFDALIAGARANEKEAADVRKAAEMLIEGA